MNSKSWSGGTIRLQWTRDARGYVIKQGYGGGVDFRGTLAETVDPQPIVHPRGGAARPYDIAIGEENVFLDLLQMPVTEEGILAFASDWGSLSGGACPVDEFFQTRREIELVYSRRWRFRQLAEALNEKKITSIDARVGRKPESSHPELLWYTRNLREFCWLEVLADLGGTSDIVRCASCANFFAHSTKMGRAPRYCSNACRQAGFRKRRRGKKPRQA